MENRAEENRRRGRAAFTLVELLIVIGIIVLLISILIPVVSKVRIAGQNAAAEAFMVQLGRSIDAYEGDFRSYPGPLTNTEVYDPNATIMTIGINPSTDYADQSDLAKKITMPENLVLGLLGGLRRNPAPPNNIQYDPTLVGGGAFSLGQGTTAKRYKTYIDAPNNLSWRLTENKSGAATWPGLPEMPEGKKTGHFRDDADLRGADDSIIPEFVDTYPDPLPILYLRAKRGATATGMLSDTNNAIVTYDNSAPRNRVGQYDLHQIISYTKSSIGVGRKQITAVGWGTPPTHGLFADASNPIDIKSALQEGIAQTTYRYPFDAYAYFRNPALSTPKESDPAYATGTASDRNDIARQKDGFILICAGQDRIYGTRDDITNFGPVVP